MTSNLHDLTGRRFGRLTVLREVEPVGRHRKWLCQCDCGNLREVLANNLTSGHTTSCGCQKRRELAGQRIGRLTVLERSELTAPRGKRQVPLWKCRCDCGEITYKATDTLTNSDLSMCAACAARYAAEQARACAGYVDGTQVSRILCHGDHADIARGVNYDKRTDKWRARLKFKGKLMNFGSYANYEDALKARKQAEEEYFGTFLKNL